METKVLENQDFDIFDGSVLSQELPLPAYNPTNFAVCRNDLSVVFVATLSTFHCYGDNSHLPDDVVEKQRKKRGYDSHLVVYKLRLKKDKGFATEQKGSHKFILQNEGGYGDNADGTTLKESADGAFLIFLCSSRALAFDSQTLQLKHSFNNRVFDILGSAVLLQLEDRGEYQMSDLSKLDEVPKPFSLIEKIFDFNSLVYLQCRSLVLHEGKCYSFAAVKIGGNVMKVYRFQVVNSEIVGHEEIGSFEANLNLNTSFFQIVSQNTCLLGDDTQTNWVNTKGQVVTFPSYYALTNQEFQTNQTQAFSVFQEEAQDYREQENQEFKLVRETEEGLLVEVLAPQQVDSFRKLTSLAGTYALIDNDHVLCSQFRQNKQVIEQLNLEIFSLSKGEIIKSLRLTRRHNTVRNDPFFAIEAFENIIDFHSLALASFSMTYEMPSEEKLLTFADACEEEDIEKTRAFYMVVEKEEKLLLRKLLMTHDRLFGEEKLQTEDLFCFDKPADTVDHAVFAEGKLFLKTERQILIANEGVVPFPEGLKFKTNLVYSPHPSLGGLKCLGELKGVTQEVDILNQRVTPDPEASGIGFFWNTVLKVYPGSVDYRAHNQGWRGKKATEYLSKGIHNCAFGDWDLLMGGVQSLLLDSDPELYSEETAVIGEEKLIFPFSSQHDIRNGLLMFTGFSRFSKYHQIKRSLKGQEFFLRYLGFESLFSIENPKDKESQLLIGYLNFNSKIKLALYTQNLQFLQLLEAKQLESILGDQDKLYGLEKNLLTKYELSFQEDKFLLIEKDTIKLELEAEEDAKKSQIRGNLLIFRNDQNTLFLDFKTGKRSKIVSTKFSLGSKQEIFFLEQDNKTIKSLNVGQVQKQEFETDGDIKEFVVETESGILAATIKANGVWFCQVIELKTSNLLRKFKIEKLMKFLVLNKEIFYKDGDQFQNVFSGKVFKNNLHFDDTSDWYQILPLLQVSESVLFVKDPAMLHHWPEKLLEAKTKNFDPPALQRLGFSTPQREFENNVFREIGLNKVLLRRFADYFIQKAEGDELKLLYDLFETPNDTIQPMFYQALEQDKLVVDIYLKMLIHAEKKIDFQHLIIRDEKDFEKMLPLKTFSAYLQQSIKVPMLQESIIQVKWNLDEDRALIPSEEEGLPKDYEKYLNPNFGKEEKENEELLTRNVIVEVLRFDFLRQKGVVPRFFKVLGDYEDETIFKMKTIDVLVNRIWSLHYPRIVRFVFLPYLFYACCFISYMNFCFKLQENGTRVESTWLQWPLLSICFVYSCLQLYIEGKQIVKNRSEYFISQGFIWNFLDLLSSFLVISISLVVLGDLDIGSPIIIIGGMACFVIWLKIFYYLRLFRPTSSFIRMIIEMFKDIRIFLLIFFIGIFAFANFYYILDQGNDEKVVGVFEGNYVGAVIYTYMQALGELGYDNFGGSSFPELYWGIFFMSTVLLTITMLNLLIAIMGDTYDRVQEVAQEAQAKEICTFIEEYDFLFPEVEFQRAPITIIASLEKAEDEETNTWEGKIGALKTFIGRQMKHQEAEAQKARLQIDEKLEKSREEAEKNMEQLKTEIKEVKEEFLNAQVRIEEQMANDIKEVKEGQVRIEEQMANDIKEVKEGQAEMREQMNRIEELLMGNHSKPDEEGSRHHQ